MPKKPLRSNSKVGVMAHKVHTVGKGEKEILKEKDNLVKANNRSPVHMLQEGQSLVGLSKTIKKNLGNYESADICCWMTDVCGSSDREKLDTLAHISEIIDEQIEYELNELLED